jgi:hypothetical protein
MTTEGPRPGRRPFVLLEHRWDGVHWDLMLDVGDVLKTWAIDTEVVAGVDLPARALGDHRRLYLDYEGAISGGRGSVRRIDRGDYTPLVWTPERVRVCFNGAQLVGEAELRRTDVGPTDSPLSWIFRLGNFD